MLYNILSGEATAGLQHRVIVAWDSLEADKDLSPYFYTNKCAAWNDQIFMYIHP